jgi:uncharacterized membrane protein YedE/YeeE
LIDLVIALLIGLTVGFILQRGRVCTNTIFRNLTLIRNSELFTIIIITISVEMIGYQLLSMLPGSNFTSNPIPLSYLLLPLGSLIFGIGTVFAGGCAGGVCYRVGEGNFKSLTALLGFAVGIAVLAVGPLSSSFFGLYFQTSITINGQIPSLEMIAPRWVWTLIFILIGLLMIAYYWNLRKNDKLKIKHLLPKWGPITSGLLLGVLGVIAKSQRNFSFSTIDGIGNIFQSLLTFQLFNWAGFFIIGLIIGSFFSSIQLKEFKIALPERTQLSFYARFFGGGFILGFGAMMALGCNFGHIFGGIPELGLSSFIALPLMILGNWIGSQIFYFKMKNPLPSTTPI